MFSCVLCIGVALYDLVWPNMAWVWLDVSWFGLMCLGVGLLDMMWLGLS